MAYTGAPSLPYDRMGIVEDGDTASRAISKDSYVIWKGADYFAKTDILQGAAFVVDTNLTAIPEGVVNAVNSNWMFIETVTTEKDVLIDLTQYKELFFYNLYANANNYDTKTIPTIVLLDHLNINIRLNEMWISNDNNRAQMLVKAKDSNTLHVKPYNSNDAVKIYAKR